MEGFHLALGRVGEFFSTGEWIDWLTKSFSGRHLAAAVVDPSLNTSLLTGLIDQLSGASSPGPPGSSGANAAARDEMAKNAYSPTGEDVEQRAIPAAWARNQSIFAEAEKNGALSLGAFGWN